MLKVIGAFEEPCHVRREIEALTYSVVSIRYDVECSQAIDAAPFHWLAEHEKKPPLDIRVNSHTGQFQSIQLVLQDEVVSREQKDPGEYNRRVGTPIFDRALWGPNFDPDHRYIDENPGMKVAWNSDSELRVSLGDSPSTVGTEYRIDNILSLLVDNAAYLIGFCLSGITDKDKQILRRAKVTA